MGWNNVLLEKENGIAVLTINRPDVLNALDADTLREIGLAMDQLDQDDEVMVVILTGAGNKAFVAGADIPYMQKLNPFEAKKFSRIGQVSFSKIENLSKPVIAAVNGYALGGGCELAMACDIRIASENAKFGQPEVSLGINAGFGATQRLPRLVNPGIAKEMLFTGKIYGAENALRIGLVNQVVPGDELMKYCMNMASLIAGNGPIAVQLTKEAINDGLSMDIEKGFMHEADIFGVAFSTEDRDEGFAAHLEKRKSEFKGR